MSHLGIAAHIVFHHQHKWCRGINVGPEIWRSLVRSRRWASDLRLRNICPKLLPGASFEPMTFEWPMSLTGLLTNLDMSLLKQGWNRFMLFKRHNLFFLSVALRPSLIDGLRPIPLCPSHAKTPPLAVSPSLSDSLNLISLSPGPKVMMLPPRRQTTKTYAFAARRYIMHNTWDVSTAKMEV